MKCIKENPTSMEYASEELLDNYDFIYNAVNLDGRCIVYASDRLRDNFSIVERSILKFNRLIKFASKRLQSNYELIYKSIKSISDLEYFENNLIYNKYFGVGDISISKNYFKCFIENIFIKYSSFLQSFDFVFIYGYSYCFKF